MSKTVIVALGLNAESDESTAVAKASRLAELERDVLALTKAKSLSDAMGILAAQAQSHEQVVALSSKVAALESDKRAAEFDALVKKGQDAAQITPAMVAGEWMKSLRGREDGVAQLKSFLATAPKVVATDPVVEVTPTDVEALNEAEIAIAKKFVGDDPVALEARLKSLREQKAQDKRSAAR